MPSTIRSAIVVLASLALPMASPAASYDCHGGRLTAVERRVCARPVLSALDERLAAAYAVARSRDEALVADQRRWISAERDRCTDDDCLFAAYAGRLRMLRTRSQACPLAEDGLLGRWINEDADGAVFESLAFERDAAGVRAFGSWLHHAPFAMGSWTFKDCAVQVSAGGAGQLDIDLTILGIDHGRLELASDMAERPLRLRRVSGH